MLWVGKVWELLFTSHSKTPNQVGDIFSSLPLRTLRSEESSKLLQGQVAYR